MQPLVSILIPTYNREAIIEETIRSALSQIYENIEIVVVDNASSDGTWAVITSLAKNHPKIRCFRNEENLGPVRNWMRCISEARGMYAKILWSDDLISSDFVLKTLPYIAQNPDVGFVFTGTEIFFSEKNKRFKCYFIGKSGLYDSKAYIEGVILNKNFPVSPGCAMFRVADLKKNLLLNIPNKIGSDFSQHAIGNDLLIYLLTANEYEKFAFVNEKLAFFRAHQGSISMDSSRSGKLALLYDLVKSYFLENFSPELIGKHNVNVFIHSKLYSYAGESGLNNLNNFYMVQTDFRLDKIYLVGQVVKLFLRKLLNK